MAKDNIYYIFIEDQNEKCVIQLTQNYYWDIKIISGSISEDLEEYSNKYDIDDIIDDLRDRFDYVEEISYGEIDDYID